ncbi:hypothetical protein Rhopal_000177-T1 [Rhodotorula paludigena]|uniref:DUF6534 domain-containing protein n=1 Tax=Rhodotorula paludigena TaxID=86838 RepID=A0AAV5GDR7_9BASI|nr:hypothetical protein Rhopal_000177-T1 [Rhodotorula paludigena]
MATGLVCAMGARYALKFHKDRLWLRLGVAAAVIWSIADTLFEFYAVSGGQWIPVGVLVILSLCTYSCSSYMTWYLTQEDSILAFTKLKTVTYSWYIGLLVTDLCTTAGLVWYLVIAPRREVKAADVKMSTQLKHVVLKAAQVNAVAAVSQIVLFITYSQYPSATYYVYIGFLEVKIYAGSFIATLNSRSAHGSGDFDESTFSRSKRGLGGGFGGFNGGLDQPVQVTVRQEMQIEAEDDDFASVSGKGASNAGVSVGGAFPVASQLPGSTYRVQFDESPRDVGMGKSSAMAA